jgi:hypothetical protein
MTKDERTPPKSVPYLTLARGFGTVAGRQQN